MVLGLTLLRFSPPSPLSRLRTAGTFAAWRHPNHNDANNANDTNTINANSNNNTTDTDIENDNDRSDPPPRYNRRRRWWRMHESLPWGCDNSA